MLEKLKQIILTILCLAGYIILPAIFVGLILFLLAVVYEIWTVAYALLTSL